MDTISVNEVVGADIKELDVVTFDSLEYNECLSQLMKMTPAERLKLGLMKRLHRRMHKRDK